MFVLKNGGDLKKHIENNQCIAIKVPITEELIGFPALSREDFYFLTIDHIPKITSEQLDVLAEITGKSLVETAGNLQQETNAIYSTKSR